MQNDVTNKELIEYLHYELEEKNRIIIKHLKNMLIDLENKL